MAGTLQLAWTFTPPDLFEDRNEVQYEACTFLIDAGRVTARCEVDSGIDAEHIQRYCTELHQRLDALFLAAQMLAHKPYDLSPPGSIKCVRADGREDSFAFPGAGLTVTMSLGPCGHPDTQCRWHYAG